MEAFKTRIRNRAIEKLKEQIEEAKQEEEIERQNRLGPGGLDPVEVFESLPAVSTYLFISTFLYPIQTFYLHFFPYSFPSDITRML